MNVNFISLGCSKNRVDSEFIMGMLTDSNHQITSNPNQADAIFINTCGFITPAKQEAINTILEMIEVKKQTNAKLIVLGCLSQRYNKELIHEIPEVDRFITLDEYVFLDEILSNELNIPVKSKYKATPRLHSTQSHLGYLKISEGCSNNCSFCAIPLIRGKYHSYPMEDLIQQSEHMAKQGVKELVLVAQDTTMYGLDLYKKQTLIELVKKCSEIEGIQWIRVLYMYPDLLDEAMIKEFSTIKKFVPYFDIPIQHTQDNILKDMKRRGDSNQIISVLNHIRNTFDEAIIRTTLIVGYPSESSDDFNMMTSFIKKHPFDKLGAFTFSKEEDTSAFNLVDLDESIKIERYQTLMEVQSSIAKDMQQQFLNKDMEVIVDKIDGITKTAKSRSKYHAPDDIDGYVYVSLINEVKVGDIISCHIDSISGYNWYATQLENCV